MLYTIISYIPALHKGYLDFFKKYPGDLYVLGPEFIKEIPRMDRDIRAIAPHEMQKLIESLGIFSHVSILNKDNLEMLKKNPPTIVMPDEDVSREFASTYLLQEKVSFVPIFLRWDKQISTKEFEVPPDRVVSENDFDKKVMSNAFKEAEKSPDWWRQIGGAIVKDGIIILVSHNKPLIAEAYTFDTFGDPRSNLDAGTHPEIYKTLHAEAGLIAQAAKQGIPLKGTSLYGTAFPCPNCAKLIATAGIERVYYSKGYSLLDAEDILRTFGIEIVLVK